MKKFKELVQSVGFPEGIAHNILSLLTFRDLARFGSLSKRCTELYLSTPKLKLKWIKVDVSTCDKWSSFSDSVDRFMNLRGDNNMHQLRIRSQVPDHRSEPLCICDGKEFRFIPWIENAVRCNVELLDLNITRANRNTPFECPSCIFSCESLRTLSVRMINATIKTPSLACLSNLEFVKPERVAIDDGFLKWISSSCKCIKELKLYHVCGVGDITIESTSLRSFSFFTSGNRLRQLKICGRKLEDIFIGWAVSSKFKLLHVIKYLCSKS